MPRGKNRAQHAAAVESHDESNTASLAVLEKMPEPVGSSEATVPTETGSQNATSRGQFRSWVVDPRRGYSGMTDETNHCLVLQFDMKPHPDVLSAVKGAGFQFRPVYYGLRNVWVRQNNFEGRLQVESIERLMRSYSEERASASI